MNFSNFQILIFYTIFFLGITFLSIIINNLLLKFVKTLGIRNNNDNVIIRWNATSKPSLGGLGFYIIFLLSIIVYSLFIVPLLNPEAHIINKQFIGVFLATTIGFMVGLFDDAYNTRPLRKFFGQILCGIILILSGTYIKLFNNEYIDYAFTILWVVGMMNSINMLDNMDAITTIVSIFILTSIIINILVNQSIFNPHIIVLFGVLASLIGFLKLNWYPSKIFMGDTGSQFLGVFLAAMGIIYLWNADISFNKEIHFIEKAIITALCFSLPIIDTTIVTIKRLAKKTSPFVGGRDHTTHHLVYFGFTERQVAYIFIILSIISQSLVILIINCSNYCKPLTYIIAIVYICALFLVKFYVSNKNIK